MNEILIALIGFYSAQYKIDPLLSLSIAKVESGLNQSVVGSKGELGVFQLLPRAFPQVSKRYLKDLKTNIELGIKHLAWTRKHCKFKSDNTWIACYNLGVSKAKTIKNVYQYAYYTKVMNQYKEFKNAK